jgi:filamentous hemagglutinin family protein
MNKCIDRLKMTDAAFINISKTPKASIAKPWKMPVSCLRDWQLGISLALRMGSAIALTGCFAITLSNPPALAQIIPDTTLGAEGSVVTPNSHVRELPAELIEGGATRGTNLFHSFQEFNVGNGQRVYFANPTGIENILTRVTGNNLSNILGTLGVDGGANLFLLNPNGIIFGANARLDIAGSFVASTADSVVFNNGYQFSVKNPEAPPLLTISVTPGLQYGTNQPRATIANSGNLTVGQNLTLSAGNLDLQGQLQAGGDLTLFAQDTVKVRDSATNPFIASSGGQLLVQGNQGVDILTLNHPTLTPFVSGSDLSLVSDGIISGDARFSSGGSFSIRTVSGKLANFVSLYDPIISANGNVDVAANYEGTSLLVEATGNIQFQGNINITGPDTNTLPPGPDTATLTTSSALILRSGQSVLAYGGVNSGAVPAFGTGVVPAGITIGGDVTLQPFNGFGGTVNLSAASGNVSIQSVTSNGGSITINSLGNITTNNLISQSFADPGNASNGGAITLTAANGNINTGFLESFSVAFSGTSGNGGAITLTAINGSINTDYLKSQSDSFFGSAPGLASGNGGAITLIAANGISTGDIFSYSGANPSDAGNGSDITVTTTNGNISTGTLYSYSGALNGNASNGGAITLSAAKGSIATGNMDAQAFAGSGAGNGGKITLLAGNDITTQAVNNFPKSFGANPSNANRNDITLNAGGNIFAESLDTGSAQSNGSTMSLKAGGNISVEELISFSAQGNSGTIALTADGNISTKFIDSSSAEGNGGASAFLAGSNISTEFIDSSSYENGNGGEITLTANDSIIATDLISNSFVGNGGAIALTAGGNIRSVFVESSSQEKGNGGNIAMTAGGNITLRPLDPEFSGNLSSYSNDGSGGTLTLKADGNILADDLNSSSFGNGNGGAIALTAGSTITATSVYTGSVEGNGGNIDLRAIGNISTEFLSSATERGNGGEITITSEAGAFSVKDAFINTNTFEQGNAGNIQIDAASVSLTNTDVSTTVTGAGNAGNIAIVADGTVLLDKSRLFTSVEPGTTGNGGDITIDASSVALKTFSYIDTATFGQGNAGDLLISAEESVELDNSSIFSSTTGQGNAGNVTVQARGNSLRPNVTLTNRSNISTAVNPTAQGNGGDIGINARSLLIGSGSQIQSRTRGEGNATNTIGRSGNIAIAADAVTISGVKEGFLSGVFTSTDAADSGEGGTINITAPGTLLVTDGGVLSAQTSSTSRGGDMFVQANTLELRNGGQLLTSTFSSGQAGDIFVNAAERITISGIDPNFNNRISALHICGMIPLALTALKSISIRI